jgi:hypothetical protein
VDGDVVAGDELLEGLYVAASCRSQHAGIRQLAGSSHTQ